MHSDSTADALADIKTNIELVCSFVENLSFADFQTDRRTVYAVTRCLEIISEASRRLLAELKHRHQDIPWNDIAAAGSVYRHAYQSVRDDFLSRTLHDSLDPLGVVIDQEIRRLGDTRAKEPKTLGIHRCLT